MPAPDSDLGEKLTRLAEGVLDEMLSTDGNPPKPPLDQRIDAIKVIGALHLGLRRLNGKVPDDSEDAGGLPAMRKRMLAAGEMGK
jgi:hypothetical protein